MKNIVLYVNIKREKIYKVRKHRRGAQCGTVIVVGSCPGGPCSNPERGRLYFT